MQKPVLVSVPVPVVSTVPPKVAWRFELYLCFGLTIPQVSDCCPLGRLVYVVNPSAVLIKLQVKAVVLFARHLYCNVDSINALQIKHFKYQSLRMPKTYASKCEVCPSNAKYRVIKFIFKCASPQTQDGIWPTNFRSKYIQNIQVASWVGGGGGQGCRS